MTELLAPRSPALPVRLAFALLLCAPGLLLAQASADGFDPAVDSIVRTMERQSNGQLLIGGAFTTVNGVARARLARINADGSTDTTFNAAITGGGAGVRAIHQQPGGKVLVGGSFTQVGGQARDHLARVNANGSLDAAFDAVLDGDVLAFHTTLSPDGLNGLIYIGGLFGTVDGLARNRVARLNAAGTLDGSFVPPNFNGQVNALAQDSLGGLIVAGAFSTPTDANLHRLLANGSRDPTFNVTTTSSNPFGDVITDVAVQPDGKIVIVGEFETVNGQARAMVARLNPNGSLDAGFVPPALNAGVDSVALQPDGRIVIGGDFTALSLRARIARLNADGSLDVGFAPLVSPDAMVNDVVIQPDGSVAIAGSFTQISGIPRSRLARLGGNGLPDQDLVVAGASDGDVEAIAYEPDGSILVAGRFDQFQGQSRLHLARVRGDGSLDPGFVPTAGNDVYAMARLPDGKILVGGAFGSISSSGRPRLTRLNADGSIDLSFDAQISMDGVVRVLAVQADGRILIGGSFTQVGGQPRARIARVHPDGALDTSFFPPGINSTVRAILVQPNGRIVVGGEFTSVGGFQRDRIARLLANGSFDTGFDAGANANDTVLALAQTPTGTLLVGGSFTTLAGGARNRFGALGADGALLAGFNLNFNDVVQTIAMRQDGAAYVGGAFTTVGGAARTRIALVNSTGSLAGWSVSMPNGQVQTIMVQPDGKPVVAGGFTTVAGLNRVNLARISAPGWLAHDVQWSAGPGEVAWVRGGPGPEVQVAPQVLVSTTCCADGDFQPIPGNSLMTRAAFGWQLTGFGGLSGPFYLRVRANAGDGNNSTTSAIDSPIHRFDGGPPVDDDADLAIVKSVDRDLVEIGDTMEFRLDIVNLGPDPATDVLVVDQLPAGFTYESHFATQGTFNPANGQWQVGALAASGAASEAWLSLIVSVNPTGPYVNTGTIEGGQVDPQPGNNTSSATLAVVPVGDVIFRYGFELIQ